MKAKVIETGEIVDVEVDCSRLHCTKYGSCNLYISEDNRVFTNEELDFTPIDWEQRRYELAKAAMQGLLSNPEALNVNVVAQYKKDFVQDIAHSAVAYADALIKELKGEE